MTYNEEDNIAQALRSVCEWAKNVFVLDSHSTDNTVAIASQFPCAIYYNKFVNYSKQRNHAINNLPIDTEWIFFVDADEWISENLADEIIEIIDKKPIQNGFQVNRRFIWMGKWIKYGYYPTWILRMFRRNHGQCEERDVNEHLIVDGTVGFFKNDLMHEDRKPISFWIDRHNKYAIREAQELFKRDLTGYVGCDFFGSQPERKRWLRYRVWNRLPPLLRPFIYYFYRYFLCRGFLDGKAAFMFHFLQALWYPLLIDINYVELKYLQKENNGSIQDILADEKRV